MVDFKNGYVTYRKKKDANHPTIMLFREILSCTCVNQPWLQGTKERTQSFNLKTMSRTYVLLAASETERMIWMDVFNLIVAITPFLLEEKVFRKTAKSANEAQPHS